MSNRRRPGPAGSCATRCRSSARCAAPFSPSRVSFYDAAKVQAKYAEGVLGLELPKNTAAEARQITIQ